MRSDPSATISWKARLNRKSPTSTLALLPHSTLAEASPRRRSLSSTTSSCSRVAVWMNSTQAARPAARTPGWPHSCAAARVRTGRSRLPPAAMIWPASCGISATGLCMCWRISSLTRSRSSRTRCGQAFQRVRLLVPPGFQIDDDRHANPFRRRRRHRLEPVPLHRPGHCNRLVRDAGSQHNGRLSGTQRQQSTQAYGKHRNGGTRRERDRAQHRSRPAVLSDRPAVRWRRHRDPVRHPCQHRPGQHRRITAAPDGGGRRV